MQQSASFTSRGAARTWNRGGLLNSSFQTSMLEMFCDTFCATNTTVVFLSRANGKRRLLQAFVSDLWILWCSTLQVSLQVQELLGLSLDITSLSEMWIILCYTLQVSLQEQELRGLKQEEAVRTRVLAELSSQRDRVALSIAQKLAKVGCVWTVVHVWHCFYFKNCLLWHDFVALHRAETGLVTCELGIKE
jgi:hypothetical protein